MKYIIPILLIASVLFISGCTGQAVGDENTTIAEADWINPPVELTGETTTTETTVPETTTTTFEKNRYWFEDTIASTAFKNAANFTGTGYTSMECVQRLNSTGQTAWKCELLA
ncbi:hypothetical protein CL614_01945 [archaeon]|nr:hypothetical protein [archaeon]|tara:strand:+ start:2222 stop:2560 length:339 start_codon:yes stop_codon:yes gene_type:complete